MSDGSFSEHDIDAIRGRIDIVEFIQSFVPVQKAGVNYKTRCPFHNEKTPSFVISPQKQIFHCFGCHKGGDIFKFLMEYESLSFPEAVSRLADRCGYVLEHGLSKEQVTVKRSEKEHLFECLDTVAQFYQKVLQNDYCAEKARVYLSKRGISGQTLRTWRLGYAPSGSDQLVQFMKKKGISEQDLVKIGILKQHEQSGKFTTRFFNRIIFPIFDDQHRVIAFGARVMDNSLPKYVNSPETGLYQKSKILYGFSHAKSSLKDTKSVLVVEGYFDVIQLHQTGITTAVAPCGTALTEKQIEFLARYVDRIYLAFDADQAGVNAAVRKLDMLLAQSIRADVVRLPEGEDPDSFVRKFGREQFEEKITQSEPVLDFLLTVLIAQHGTDDEFSKVKIAEYMMELIARQPNNLLVESWIKRIEKALGFSEGVLREEIGKKKKKYSQEQVRHVPLEKPKYSSVPIPPWEKEIMRLIVQEKEGIFEIVKNTLKKEFFSNIIIRQIYDKVFSDDLNGCNSFSDRLLDIFRNDEGTLSILTELISLEREEGDPILVFNQEFKRLKKAYIESKITECMKLLETAGEDERKELQKQHQALEEEKRTLGIYF